MGEGPEDRIQAHQRPIRDCLGPCPAFRSAFKHRRCLIPTTGFFEWKRDEGKKQPYLIRMHDARPFAFAGLWVHWTGEGGELIESCTILTTASDELIGEIHNHMAVIIKPEQCDVWLDTTTPKECPKFSLRAIPLNANDYIRGHQPGQHTKYDRPECIEPGV
jgi:putative SOS response-associated peptidase YedK